MKRIFRSFLALLFAAVLVLPVLAACGADSVDYAGELKLDMSSETKKQEVTIRLQIDGDTTHFNPVKNSTVTPNANPADFDKTDGYIKARYIAINTPESTGKIEKWGKTASLFTKEKLASAESIIIESDDGQWNIDSTGERYVLWIWYKPQGGADYRNLNIEILQNGLAWGSSTVNNRYGDIASKALMQAQEQQLHIFSPPNTVDENYFGNNKAAAITLKELRCHFSEYVDQPVMVEGTVTAVYDNNAYIEDYDADTGTYFGMQVYLHFTLGTLREIYKAGNRVRVYGTASESTFGKQISDVSYNDYDPDYYKNSKIVENPGTLAPVFREIEPKDIAASRDVSFQFENDDAESGIETVTLDYRDVLLNTSATLKNLTVTDVYTTSKGDSTGAMTITCTAKNTDGTTSTVSIRTEVLYDANNKLVTAATFPVGKVIKSVKGIVGLYTPESTGDPSYQLNVPAFDMFEL